MSKKRPGGGPPSDDPPHSAEWDTIGGASNSSGEFFVFQDGHMFVCKLPEIVSVEDLETPVQQRAMAADSPILPLCKHSEGFNSVVWYGQHYTFTTAQAACVKVLWESAEDGMQEMLGSEITRTAGLSQERLDLVFRVQNKKHPAWGKMITKGEKKGFFKLAKPTG